MDAPFLHFLCTLCSLTHTFSDWLSILSLSLQDEYWQNFTRRARLKRERRQAQKEKNAVEVERIKKEKAERRKKRLEEKKKRVDVADVSSSESEGSSDEELEVKRDDKSSFVPFHKKTTRFQDNVCVITGGGRGRWYPRGLQLNCSLELLYNFRTGPYKR